MNIRSLTAVAALVIGAMGVTSGTSYADPAPPIPAPVQYESKLVDKSVVTTLTGGLFEIKDAGKSVDVKDGTGHVLVNFPLAYNLDNLQFPIANQVADAGTKLILTAITDPAKAVPRPALHDVASVDENQKAMGAFSAQLGIAMSVGGLIGLTIGAIVGALIGFPLAPTVIGYIGAIAVIAGLGSIIGTIVAGVPTAIIAGIDLVNALNAPPGTSKYAPGR